MLLPKVVELGQSASAASVDSMAGTLRQAANNIRMRCVVLAASSGCDLNVPRQRDMIKNQWYFLNFAYPDSGDSLGGDEIDIAINCSGFTVTLADYRSTRFSKEGEQAAVPGT